MPRFLFGADDIVRMSPMFFIVLCKNFNASAIADID